VLFPDVNFIPPDRVNFSEDIRDVATRIRQGVDISDATKPESKSGVMAESNVNADRDEDFNTRYGSFRGWQLAIEKVKPIPRDIAKVDVTKMVLDHDLANTTQVVDYMIHRFMRVPPGAGARQKMIDFLDHELGTSDIGAARTYMEEPLRKLLHLVMSQPEFQLG